MALVATARHAVPFPSGIAVAVLVPAAVVDVRERRLPNRTVAAAGGALVAGTALAALAGSHVSTGHALAGTIAFAGPLLALHLTSPAAMGFGDVKAGVVIGCALGLVHWQLALAALALATGLTATVGLLTRARTVAFGPGLVVAAALVLATAPLFAPIDDTPTEVGTRPPGVTR